ncbi:hypothetical protein IF2G_04894 [Cordyceps javanica]|nr:hypothetical protein IF2G_04894 [Cordyceps javanica]
MLVSAFRAKTDSQNAQQVDLCFAAAAAYEGKNPSTCISAEMCMMCHCKRCHCGVCLQKYGSQLV